MKLALVSIAALLAMSQLTTVAAEAATPPRTVTVQLLDVASGKGNLMVSLCDRGTFMKRCASSQRVPARRGTATVTFRGIRPGRYAVMAFHDENGDGRMGRTSIGAPSEGWGFSRDARGVASAPSFEQAAINVPAAGAVVPVHLVY